MRVIFFSDQKAFSVSQIVGKKEGRKEAQFFRIKNHPLET